jgi:hypothetical protein
MGSDDALYGFAAFSGGDGKEDYSDPDCGRAANLVTEHLGELIATAWAGIARIRRTPNLAYGFLHGCGLKAW